ncbi:hypothetical protein A5699_20760 [Mycobacterium sp. E802]|uniref:hypothetical protein n=1 Tax=Mycobacterium sp. E802 TaxID=1834152 RepID=UPI0008008D69|nr:hypothetical protein [Mycobacterium sp. E802]OBG86750.1 hypothetical protein A5699_20760 [Mycobacterium sp. E802]
MTLYVNHESLNKISQSLARASADLDSTSASAPTSVDGGWGTPAILGILAQLTDNAGQLVVAVKAVADGVASASASYLSHDEAGAEALDEAMRPE